MGHGDILKIATASHKVWQLCAKHKTINHNCIKVFIPKPLHNSILADTGSMNVKFYEVSEPTGSD